MGTASKAQHTWPRSLFVLHFSLAVLIWQCSCVQPCELWSSVCTSIHQCGFLACVRDSILIKKSVAFPCVLLNITVYDYLRERVWHHDCGTSLSKLSWPLCANFMILLCLQCLIKCVQSWPYIGINHLCHEQCMILCTNLKWDKSSLPWTVDGQSWYADVDISFVCCGA